MVSLNVFIVPNKGTLGTLSRGNDQLYSSLDFGPLALFIPSNRIISLNVSAVHFLMLYFLSVCH